MTSLLDRPILRALLPGLFAMLLAGAALADPPGRVGRIAWMSGTVQLRNADTGEWNTAVLNYPLTNGDALSTGPGARLEIGIGSTVVRLDSSSELAVDQLDDKRVRLYLVSGTAAVRLRSREAAREFELATSTGRFTVQDVGAFRFDFDDNVTAATAYLGTLRFESEDSALDVPAGQRAQFWYSGRTMYSTSAPVRDDFSDWNIARDQRLDTRETRRHVSQEMTGYDDLAGYGSWYESVDYGPVWYPSVVPAGWAPYRAGHWAWVSPWGWTWIDDAPWGFAPFHYGRWVWHRDRWGWAPGRRIVRPVYAPALVAWIDTPRVAVGISSGPAVGWFPLAPREIYVPGYRCSTTYVRNINVTNITHVRDFDRIVQDPRRINEHNRYVNRHLPQAVTIVPADVVTQRRPVAPAVERPQNPRVLDNIMSQPPLVAAPVAAPPLPPRRHDADSRDERRDGRDANRHDRRDERRDAPPVFAQPRPPGDGRTSGAPAAQPPGQVGRPPTPIGNPPGGAPDSARKPDTPGPRAIPPALPPQEADRDRNRPFQPLEEVTPGALQRQQPPQSNPVAPARQDGDRGPGRSAEPRQPVAPLQMPPPAQTPHNPPNGGWSAGTPQGQPPAQVNRPRRHGDDGPAGEPVPTQRSAEPQPRPLPRPMPRPDSEPGAPRPAIEPHPAMRQVAPPAPRAAEPPPRPMPRPEVDHGAARPPIEPRPAVRQVAPPPAAVAPAPAPAQRSQAAPQGQPAGQPQPASQPRPNPRQEHNGRGPGNDNPPPGINPRRAGDS